VKLLIAEDEYNGAKDICDLLAEVSPQIRTIVVNSPIAALQTLRAADFDGAIFDAVWPTRSYVEIIQELGPRCPPFAFLTTNPEFALTAFELGAVDYLVKPIDTERLDLALNRIQAKRAGHATALRNSVDNIVLREGENMWVLKPDEIYLIEALQNYCKIYFREQKVMVRRPLKSLLDKLAPHGFFRVSRDWIVNIRQIEQCSTTVARTLKVRLTGGMELEMSRRQTKLFRELYTL
jgi:two-component system, LytTR family, response regulator